MDFYGVEVFEPITSDRLIANYDELVLIGLNATSDLVWSDGPAGNRKPSRGLYGTPGDLHSFGLACLALRARALKESGPGFRSTYATLCSDSGLDICPSKFRRHTMYFPILSGDDGFREIIEAESKRLGWLFDRPMVGTEYISQRMKSWRMADVAIDWIPFGGAPPT